MNAHSGALVNKFRYNIGHLRISRSVMAKKIDALNRKQYGAVTAMLTVTDIKAAAAFYQKALGFTRRGGFMNGPDGKPTQSCGCAIRL